MSSLPTVVHTVQARLTLTHETSSRCQAARCLRMEPFHERPRYCDPHYGEVLYATSMHSKVKRHHHHGLWIDGSLLLPCRESSTDHVCKEVVLRRSSRSGRSEGEVMGATVAPDVIQRNFARNSKNRNAAAAATSAADTASTSTNANASATPTATATSNLKADTTSNANATTMTTTTTTAITTTYY